MATDNNQTDSADSAPQAELQADTTEASDILNAYLAEHDGKTPDDPYVLVQFALNRSVVLNYDKAELAITAHTASQPQAANTIALKLPDDADLFDVELKHDQSDEVDPHIEENETTEAGRTGELSKIESPDVEAGEHSDSFYEYEVDGAPWWMPVDESIVYKSNAEIVVQPPNAAPKYSAHDANNVEVPGADNNNNNNSNNNPTAQNFTAPISKSRAQTIIDPGSEDVTYMDSVQVVVANSYLKEQAQQKQDKRGYILSIDLQVQCRKYLLFTSLLLFIVVVTFASSVYTGFYEWKGYLFNIMVSLVLMYGVLVGFVCADMNKYKTRNLLFMLNVYWSLTWTAAVGLALTACVYLVLFPNKFRNYCKTRAICESSTAYIAFAEMTLVCSLLVYITMMLYYMSGIAKLVILISNLRDYKLKYEHNKFMRKCHKHVYRYLKGWKALRKTLTRATGIKLSDLLYCSCWFRKCARKSSSKWKPASQQEKKREKERKKHKNHGNHYHNDLYFHDTTFYVQPAPSSNSSHSSSCCADGDGDACCCCCGPRGDGLAHGVCVRDCFLCCDCNEICNGCGECLRDMCICQRIDCSGTDSGCCRTYHSESVGDCGECCKALGNICGCCGCCDGGCSCDCGGCDGGGEGILALAAIACAVVVAIVIFLLPVIVFACIAAPFWLCAQWVCWKLNDKVPWALVVLVFIVFLIPPCVIWAYIWSAICLSGVSSTFMTIICLIWSFFHAVYTSVA